MVKQHMLSINTIVQELAVIYLSKMTRSLVIFFNNAPLGTFENQSLKSRERWNRISEVNDLQKSEKTYI